MDSIQLNSDHQEMARLTSNLIKLFNDKDSLQEAKMTKEATEALNNNVVGFKNWCRANLGTASRTPSVTSVRSSIRSSVHSSASSAERRRNAAADVAAAKAQMIYEKEALELENEVADLVRSLDHERQVAVGSASSSMVQRKEWITKKE